MRGVAYNLKRFRVTSLEHNLEAMVDTGYQVRVSSAAHDAEWDAFLAKTPGGHHVQTSLWAQVKALLGWGAVRIVIQHNEQIVAGAQVLMRSLPLVSAISYVPKGPVFASDDPALIELVMSQLHQIVKAHRLQYLAMHPPNNGKAFTLQLPGWGFQPASIDIMPTATILIDLAKDTDTILAEMNPKTRYNIHLGQRKKIFVREGTEGDLRAYYHILRLTGQRQNFAIFPQQYYLKMWRVFSPHGYIKLFLAEYESDIVSAQLAIPFGDTVINKLSVWSGRHGSCRPNEVLQWAAIEWAKSQGHRYYDFEGIELEAAAAILQDKPLPDELRQTVTSFKLGFGGQVTRLPRVYDYIYNPIFRWVYNVVFPKISSSSVVKNTLNYLRIR